MDFSRLQGVTTDSKRLQGVKVGYWRVTRGYSWLKGVTKAYKTL